MCDLRSGLIGPLVRELRFGIRYDRRQLNRFSCTKGATLRARVDD